MGVGRSDPCTEQPLARDKAAANFSESSPVARLQNSPLGAFLHFLSITDDDPVTQEITPVSFLALSAGPFLTSLTLDSCFLSRADVLLLAAACPTLAHLSLVGCRGLST